MIIDNRRIFQELYKTLNEYEKQSVNDEWNLIVENFYKKLDGRGSKAKMKVFEVHYGLEHKREEFYKKIIDNFLR